MESFWLAVLSGIISTVGGAILISGFGALVGRVRQQGAVLGRLLALAFTVPMVGMCVLFGWLLHQCLYRVALWGAAVLGSRAPEPEIAEVQGRAVELLAAAGQWPWQYVTAGFTVLLVFAPAQLSSTETGLSDTLANAVSGVVVVLTGCLTAAVVGAHLLVDRLSGLAYEANARQVADGGYDLLPGATQAWSVPWGLEWTLLAGAVAATAWVTFHSLRDMLK